MCGDGDSFRLETGKRQHILNEDSSFSGIQHLPLEIDARIPNMTGNPLEDGENDNERLILFFAPRL
jgi:hypothetical protein